MKRLSVLFAFALFCGGLTVSGCTEKYSDLGAVNHAWREAVANDRQKRSELGPTIDRYIARERRCYPTRKRADTIGMEGESELGGNAPVTGM